MASMKAFHSAAGHRALASGSGVSSLRVKPFTALARPIASRSASLVRPRAAALEADLDFAFSLSDAKKGNEYTASDVEAALRFYESGEGLSPAFDADFVTNALGTEDASFFDDIDNEDAYGNEYIVAGIPEAQPKQRGRGRAQGGADKDEDDVEQAKELEKVKALEDRMVLEAALEEEFGAGGAVAMLADGDSAKPGVWEWLTDLEATEAADSSELVATAPAETEAGGVSDAQVTVDIASAKVEMFEDPEVQAYLDLFSNDDLSEDVLDTLGAAPGGEDDSAEPVSSITDEELARLDALIDEEIPVLNLKRVEGPAVPRLNDFPELEQEAVDKYIARLREVVSSGAHANEDEVKALFGDEPLTLEVGVQPDPAAKKETAALLAAPEPKLSAPEDADFSAELAALEDVVGEPGEEDDSGLGLELRALAAIDKLSETDFQLDPEVMDNLEGYVVAGEDYVAKEEERMAGVVAAVSRGELSADALAEELEALPDAVDELLADGAFEGAEEPDAPLDDDADSEGWVERIIELTRVTKVVKGGKIMGFRCVAIIGNQNGLVGVGCQAGREVAIAVKRTLVDAKRNVVRVPLVGAGTVPHRMEAKYHAARCVVLPASDGTGCIAGGSVRSVLELAGVKNCLAKRIGSRSALNSARATVRALQQMQSLQEVSQARGVPMEQLLLP